MVQDSGADSLRLDIVIQTIAKVQAIEQTSAKLLELSQVTGRARNVLGQYTSETIESAEKTRKLQKDLGEVISKGFGPRFIGSVTGVNAALVSAGKTFQDYTKKALEGGAISEQTAQNFSALSQGMIGVGVTGKATTATFDVLDSKLAELRPRLDAGKEGVAALRNELALLKIQFIEAGNAAEERFNKPLSQSQKAGQGLLLSFSISQLAAGRLSQAMFGLGFAILFTGTKFLNLTTITVALGAALASFVLDKIVASFKRADTVTEQVSKSMERFNLALDEAKGKPRLLAEEFQALAQAEEDFLIGFDKFIGRIENPPESRGFLKGVEDDLKGAALFAFKTEKAIEDLKTSFMTRVPFFGEGWEQDTEGLEQELLKIARAGEDVDQAYTGMTAAGREFEGVSIGKNALIDLRNLSAGIEGITQEIIDTVSSIQHEVQRKADLKILLDPFEIDREATERTFAVNEQLARDHLDDLTDTVRDGLADQIKIRQAELQIEQDIIRESLRVETEIIRDGLEEQIRVRQRVLEDQISAIRDSFEVETDVIRDALDQQIDVIREQSDIQIDIIKDTLDDRIKAIKDATSQEIDVEKDKISEIKKLERELSKALQDLGSERSKIITSIIGAEAQLAALEAASASSGVAATEEANVIRARIEGLQAEGEAIEESIADKERDREGLEAQIETIEELIEAIEDARDSAVEAAKDAADAQVKAAKDAADDEIKIAKKASEKKIDIINDTRDEAIRAAQDIADNDIREATRAADGIIREAQRASKEATKAAADRSADEIKLYREAADSQIEGFNRVHDVFMSNFEIQRDSALELIDLEKERRLEAFKYAETITNDVIPKLQEMIQLAVPSTGGSIDRLLEDRRAFQRAFIKLIFPNADAAFFESIGLGFQFGGIVPGPTGKPQMAIVHGGEEIRTPQQQLTAGLPAQFILQVNHMDVNQPSDIRKVVRAVNKMLGQKTNTNIRIRRNSIR